MGGKLDGRADRRCLLETSDTTLRIQDEQCSKSGGHVVLPFGIVCRGCLAAANDKVLVLRACRFSMMLDLADMLDVSLNDPESAIQLCTKIRSEADYAAYPVLRHEVDSFVGMTAHELAAALEKKMHRHDSDFVEGAEWHNIKAVRFAVLLKRVAGDKNPRKAAVRVLSGALAGHIADGSLSSATVGLSAKIASGGLRDAPVVEGIVTATLQRLEFQQRQGCQDPNMRELPVV